MKVQLAPHIEQLSGSLGGIVYFKGATGNTARLRVDPKQPRTSAQVSVRDSFTNFSKKWRTLTQAQRDSWNTLAKTITKSGTYGVNYKTTGQREFVGINQNRLLLELAELDTAPAIVPVVPTLDGVVITAHDPGTGAANIVLGISFDPDPLPTPVLIYMTDVYSAGREYISPSQYRLIGTLPAAAASGQDLKPGFLAKYGHNIAVNTKLAVKLVPCSANGFQGNPVYDVALVTAA